MLTERFRELVLGLGGVTAAPHFDRVAFRTPRRTFVTLSADGADANVALEPDHQALLVAERPEVFEPVAGGWGRQGWTRMWIARATEADVRHALGIAHALAQPKAKAKSSTRAAKAKAKSSTRAAKAKSSTRAAKAKVRSTE